MGVTSVALSRDGRKAISGGLDHTVRVWEVESGKEVACLEGHTEVVSSVALSPEGHLAASGSSDRTVRFWNVAPPGEPLQGPHGMTGAAHDLGAKPTD